MILANNTGWSLTEMLDLEPVELAAWIEALQDLHAKSEAER